MKGRHAIGRRSPNAFGERQQRRNDGRHRLAAEKREVVVHRMRGTPLASAASCGEVRSD